MGGYLKNQMLYQMFTNQVPSARCTGGVLDLLTKLIRPVKLTIIGIINSQKLWVKRTPQRVEQRTFNPLVVCSTKML